MQPTQLSLLLEQFAAPPEVLLDQLPQAQVAAALAMLSRVIAKAALGEADEAGSDDE